MRSARMLPIQPPLLFDCAQKEEEEQGGLPNLEHLVKNAGRARAHHDDTELQLQDVQDDIEEPIASHHVQVSQELARRAMSVRASAPHVCASHSFLALLPASHVFAKAALD
jgi:hypothetical protein